MKKTTQYIIWTILFANALAIAVSLFWLLYPYNIATVTEPITILNKNHEIAVGEPIMMWLQVDKQTESTPETTAFITCNDGNLVTMNATSRTLPVGQYDIISENFLLPPKVLTGAKCEFNFTNVYRVNPLRTITQEWTSETFTVKE